MPAHDPLDDWELEEMHEARSRARALSLVTIFGLLVTSALVLRCALN
jgi:hypothetical protein